MTHTLQTATFFPTDRLYASISVKGRVIAEFVRDGFSDTVSVHKALRQMASEQCGLVRLTVRNMTRGWAFTEPCMLRRSAPAMG